MHILFSSPFGSVYKQMNILSRYILKEHFTPFVFAFFIITFVLILETIPRLVDMVVGKSVSAIVMIELVVLNLAWMLALSVPMATLVSTLAAFGRLTADFEMLAIKLTGTNILRLLLPLLLAVTVLTALMIKFNDTVLPELNHEARMLMGDIRATRPTLIFRPGLFVDDIRGYLILLDRVNHQTSEVGGVRINDIRDPQAPVMIIADHGLMEFVDGGNTIKFTLYDGEIHEMNIAEPDEYRQIRFGKQIFYVTDIGTELHRTESTHKTDREMNIQEMENYINELRKSAQPYRNRSRNLVTEQVTRLLKPVDSVAQKVDPELEVLAPTDTLGRDSLALVRLLASVDGVNRQLDRAVTRLGDQRTLINKYMIEIHKKYSIPFACIAFVLFGAPLGILSRRAGMGFSISVSLGLFVIYWAFLIGGESLADRGLADPFWAMWGANFLIGGIGMYLMYMVHAEKQFLSFLRRS